MAKKKANQQKYSPGAVEAKLQYLESQSKMSVLKGLVNPKQASYLVNRDHRIVQYEWRQQFFRIIIKK